jgi:UDP-glucuronate decarboxylase
MIKNRIINEDVIEIKSRINFFHYFKDKTLLISGAGGFLPAYLVDTLMSLDNSYNIRIIAIVRNLEKAKKRLVHWSSDKRLKIVEHDVIIPYESKIKIDFIIHAASQASPKYYGVDPVGTLNPNVIGTINLLNLAKDHQVESFLFFSSGEVYGEVDYHDIPIKEDTFGYLNPTKVRACYGESKRMGENICISYHAQFGVNTKIVRPFHTYGPGMLLDDGRVFADFVSNVLNKQDLLLKSDGSSVRAFCYISDATVGFLNVLVNGVNGEAYNVGNPYEEKSIYDLALIISNIYPELNLKVKRSIQDNLDSNYLKSPISRNSPDINKIIKLGWNPIVNSHDGFKRTIESFINN